MNAPADLPPRPGAGLPRHARATCAGCTTGSPPPRRPTASSTSPTAPSTPRSARCCWPRPSRGWSGWRTPREDHDAVLQTLSDRISPRILPRPRGWTRPHGSWRSTSRAAGTPSTCRWTGGCRPGSARTVLHRCPSIGYGHTASYAAVARLAGNPKAVRAVGTACATNPLPVVVPCHRVVRSDGSHGRLRRRRSRPSAPCSTWRRQPEGRLPRLGSAVGGLGSVVVASGEWYLTVPAGWRPVRAARAGPLTDRRVVLAEPPGAFRYDVRAVSEPYQAEDGECTTSTSSASTTGTGRGSGGSRCPPRRTGWTGSGWSRASGGRRPAGRRPGRGVFERLVSVDAPPDRPPRRAGDVIDIAGRRVVVVQPGGPVATPARGQRGLPRPGRRRGRHHLLGARLVSLGDHPGAAAGRALPALPGLGE